MPEKIYLSGGGAHNLTLVEFLSAYFQPIIIKNIEELGIPADMRIPLALGLTVNSYLAGTSVPWETGSNPRITEIGRWIFP
jgi:1,6-anhydro-N-acetylmuramate kinase